MKQASIPARQTSHVSHASSSAVPSQARLDRFRFVAYTHTPSWRSTRSDCHAYPSSQIMLRVPTNLRTASQSMVLALVALVTSGCLSVPSTATTESPAASSGTAQLLVPAPSPTSDPTRPETGVAVIRGAYPETDTGGAGPGRPSLSNPAVQHEIPTCSIESGIGVAVTRGASSETGPYDAGLGRTPLSNMAVDREIPTCSIEPVLSLVAGDASPQTRQDAAQSLALMGVTGAAAAFHRAGPARTLHQIAGASNDLLQPDDETTPMKKSRPPLFFTVGFGY